MQNLNIFFSLNIQVISQFLVAIHLGEGRVKLIEDNEELIEWFQGQLSCVISGEDWAITQTFHKTQ